MKSLMILLTLMDNSKIYIDNKEIITISDSICNHYEGEFGLIFNQRHTITEKCTEISLKNGKYLYVKEKVEEVLKLKR